MGQRVTRPGRKNVRKQKTVEREREGRYNSENRLAVIPLFNGFIFPNFIL